MGEKQKGQGATVIRIKFLSCEEKEIFIPLPSILKAHLGGRWSRKIFIILDTFLANLHASKNQSNRSSDVTIMIGSKMI